jgi:hypothetical protein
MDIAGVYTDTGQLNTPLSANSKLGAWGCIEANIWIVHATAVTAVTAREGGK